MSKEDKAKLDAGAEELRELEKQQALQRQHAEEFAQKSAHIEPKPTTATMQFHELCKMFQILPAKEMKALKADIEAHGIKVPILVNKKHDTILDGRNRYMIAMDLGFDLKNQKQVPTETFRGKEEDIAAEIIARNILRRHLSLDQRVALVSKIRGPQLEKEAAARQGKKPRGAGGDDGHVKGSVAAHVAKEAKASQYKAEQAEKARKAGVLDKVIEEGVPLNKATRGKGKRKTRKQKEVSLEDQVWHQYSKYILKHFGIEREREVKKILRGFLDNKPSK
jgi:ParB-like chromosome segregation protein Spo0J